MNLKLSDPENTQLRGSRKFLRFIFVLGALGTLAELLLLEHTDLWQLIPVVLLVLGLVIFGWDQFSNKPISRMAFSGVMGLFLVSGLVGIWLHYRSNTEFELEMYPSLHGISLFWESMKGAIPALAPGAMVMLALIGYTITSKTITTKRNENEKIETGEP